MDNRIPPVFRSALDEPAPPTPPDSGPDRDDGDGHHHVFMHIPVPLFAVYGDGSVVANDWRGTLIQGWCWGASLFTAFVIGRGAWGWFAGGWPFNFRGGVFVGAMSAALLLVIALLTVLAYFAPTRRKQILPVVLLMLAVAMLTTVVFRWLP